MVRIKVFISYAWESDKFKADVWDLALWLDANDSGIEVIIDQLHSITPPEEGFLAWMIQQVTWSDITLVVCSESYKKRFQKEEEVGKGRGVILEGAIITQELFNAQLRNKKFYPILPDTGNIGHVPILLLPWENNHKFPSGNSRILDLIHGRNPTFPKAGVESNSVNSDGVLITILAGTTPKESMLSPIQLTVRAFLELNDPAKKGVSEKIGAYDPSFDLLDAEQRDRKIFEVIKQKELLTELWEAINQVKRFENQINPFKV